MSRSIFTSITITKLSYIFLIIYLISISNFVYCQSYTKYNSLINKLDDESDGFYAQIELQKIGNPAVESLINALNNVNTEKKQRIIIILGEIRDPRAIGPLVGIYKRDPDLRTKIELESALEKLGLDRGEILNWPEIRTESGTESNVTSYSIVNHTANEPIAEDQSDNITQYLWIFFVLAVALVIWRHFSGTNEDTNIQINPPVIIPPPPRPEDIIVELDGFREETVTTMEPNISASSKYTYVTQPAGISQYAQCICRSNIVRTLNDMGGTIKCNNCDVLQHLECARILNQGRCINCQENLGINT